MVSTTGFLVHIHTHMNCFVCTRTPSVGDGVQVGPRAMLYATQAMRNCALNPIVVGKIEDSKGKEQKPVAAS